MPRRFATRNDSIIKSKAPILWLLCTLLAITCHPSSANTNPVIDDELRQLLKDTIAQSDSFEDKYDAEVWLVSKREPLKRFIKDPKERMDLLRKIHRAATQADL
ncbi:MAG: hypothetical protein AseanaTS_05030 [Candidatus Pelagadaptatus aseana]